MDIEVEFQPEANILEYCLVRNSAVKDGQIPDNAAEEPVFRYGYCSYMAICDQNGEIFNELNALIIGLSPLVYRRPYYEQHIDYRGKPFIIPVETSRRPRLIILRAIQYKPGITGVSNNKYKNYSTPWQFRWIPFDKVTCRILMTYMSQNFLWEEITFDQTIGDGTDGT